MESWNAVESWFDGYLLPEDPALESVLQASADAGIPNYHVSPSQGKFLWLLARACGSRRILEIGTLAGYSSVWLARALPKDGQLITLELDPIHARVAQENFRRLGLQQSIELCTGDAMVSLARLENENSEPFDLVFVDADKQRLDQYYSSVVKLVRPGGLMIFDNVVRAGGVISPESSDQAIQGVQRLVERISESRTVHATTLQTVGTKGYDGFIMALVDPSDTAI